MLPAIMIMSDGGWKTIRRMLRKCEQNGERQKPAKEKEEGMKSMSTRGKTTKRTAEIVSSESRAVATRETRAAASRHYSTELNEGIQAQQTLIGSHAQRLSNLIHSEVWKVENEFIAAENPEDMTVRLSEQSMHSVIAMGNQLLETIKLGVAVAGVKMQIERGMTDGE